MEEEAMELLGNHSPFSSVTVRVLRDLPSMAEEWRLRWPHTIQCKSLRPNPMCPPQHHPITNNKLFAYSLWYKCKPFSSKQRAKFKSCLIPETDLGEPGNWGTETVKHGACTSGGKVGPSPGPRSLAPTGVVALISQKPSLSKWHDGLTGFSWFETNCLDNW